MYRFRVARLWSTPSSADTSIWRPGLRLDMLPNCSQAPSAPSPSPLRSAIRNFPTCRPTWRAVSPDLSLPIGSAFSCRGKLRETIAVKLNETVEAVVREPDVQTRLRSLLMEPRYGDRPSTETFFKEELAQWANMTRAIGLVEK